MREFRSAGWGRPRLHGARLTPSSAVWLISERRLPVRKLSPSRLSVAADLHPVLRGGDGDDRFEQRPLSLLECIVPSSAGRP